MSKANNQYTPDWANSAYFTYTGTAGVSAALPVGYYEVRPSSDAWVKAGSATPTASVGAGSVFVRAGDGYRFINTDATFKVSAVQATAAGACSVTKLT